MKRSFGVVLVALILLALVPMGAAGAPAGGFTYVGKGSARVLDLDIPVLASVFKGVTLGVSSAEFSSDPKVTGFAAGRCDYLGPNSSAASSCSAASKAESSATAASPTGGASAPKCEVAQTIAVVQVQAVCGSSVSDVTGGKLAGVNRAGEGLINVSLDLSSVLPGAGPQAEAAKDAAVDLIVGVIKAVDNQVPSQANIDSITSKLVDHLNAIKEAKVPAATILNGVATTDITSDASKLTVASGVAGVKIELLRLTNPLDNPLVQDALVIIEVTGANSSAVWDGAKGEATAAANPGAATLKVKDLADLFPGTEYITQTANLPQLNNLLSALNGTPLETSIEAATVNTTQQGRSASASTSGVRIRGLKGLLSSGVYSLDLRIAGTDASVSGAPITSIESPLPKTGGASKVFFIGAAALAILALFGLGIARRLRASA
jgi:LPXTG-motif cell wall-anchored protein